MCIFFFVQLVTSHYCSSNSKKKKLTEMTRASSLPLIWLTAGNLDGYNPTILPSSWPSAQSFPRPLRQRPRAGRMRIPPWRWKPGKRVGCEFRRPSERPWRTPSGGRKEENEWGKGMKQSFNWINKSSWQIISNYRFSIFQKFPLCPLFSRRQR